MQVEYHNIRDAYRKGLLKYLSRAISGISLPENAEILDIGCGTGVPALFMAKNHNVHITAVDPDATSIQVLKERIRTIPLKGTIEPFQISFSEMKTHVEHYDLILAEGFLNVVGFRKSFPAIVNLLKKKRHIWSYTMNTKIIREKCN
ncbi:MAG: class I SAM-dependent methyltransferase [Bacteroidales bacterium]|nr:class I SAM-dependent methyltransferase [Bacteroidales bacterium]MCF8387530.1 class I SAM-dependent methyltransferase [Bacteroidales bacterium]MCF8398089.1 class I SAM-dependent methyltransferase [Bacteroidales bacterium]